MLAEEGEDGRSASVTCLEEGPRDSLDGNPPFKGGETDGKGDLDLLEVTDDEGKDKGERVEIPALLLACVISEEGDLVSSSDSPLLLSSGDVVEGDGELGDRAAAFEELLCSMCCCSCLCFVCCSSCALTSSRKASSILTASPPLGDPDIIALISPLLIIATPRELLRFLKRLSRRISAGMGLASDTSRW